MSNNYFVAHTATYSPRMKVLENAVDNYAEQFDLWVIYLNDIDDVPEFLTKRKNVRVILGKDSHGDLKDLAKFFLAGSVEERGTHFMLDDDLVLPSGFAKRMNDTLNAYGRKAVIGTYGGMFKKTPLEDYSKDRRGFGTHKSSVLEDMEVEWLGSGIIAYDPDVFKINMDDTPEPHMGDIWLSMKAWKSNVPLVLMAHEKNWISFNPVSDDTPSVYEVSTVPKAGYYASVVNKNLSYCPQLSRDVDNKIADEKKVEPIKLTLLQRTKYFLKRIMLK